MKTESIEFTGIAKKRGQSTCPLVPLFISNRSSGMQCPVGAFHRPYQKAAFPHIEFPKEPGSLPLASKLFPVDLFPLPASPQLDVYQAISPSHHLKYHLNL